MELSKLEQLGTAAFAQSIEPLKRPKLLTKARVLGWDTEYDSQTGELLSVQLATAHGPAHFHEIKRGQKLDWSMLWKWSCDVLKEAGYSVARNQLSTILLVTHFSLAEIQHLPWWADMAYIREHSQTYEWSYPGTTRRAWLCPACYTQRVIRENGFATCARCGFQDSEQAFEYKRPAQIMRVIDLQTWFVGQSLAAVANVFGERKLDWERDRVSRADLLKPGFKEYAIHDAVLCARIYESLRETFSKEWGVDIAETRTPASTSGAILRARYVYETINNPHHRSRRLGMLANWGGNNQAFVRGYQEGLFYEYDAVSMYPNAAITLGVLPRAHDIVYLRPDEVFSSKVLGGWAHVEFEFPSETVYPCLPVFDGRALCYPLKGESYCTIEELRFARELGAKLTIREAYGYATGTDALTRYLIAMMKGKDEAERAGDTVRRSMYKLLLNSVIGKLCQKVVKWDVNDLKKLEQYFQIPVKDLLRMDEKTFLLHAEEFERVTGQICRMRVNVGSLWLPEWNTLILGYARATLARAFHETKSLLGTTDSLITDRDMGETFVVNRILFERRTWGTNMSVVRTRLYALWGGYCLECKTGDVDEDKGTYTCRKCGGFAGQEKIAYHAIHNAQAAKRILKEVFVNGHDEANYTIPLRFVRLREALRTGRALGAPIREIPRTVMLGWDEKRKLIEHDSKRRKRELFERFSPVVRSDIDWKRRVGYDGDETMIRNEIEYRILQGVFGEDVKHEYLDLMRETVSNRGFEYSLPWEVVERVAKS